MRLNHEAIYAVTDVLSMAYQAVRPIARPVL